VLEDFTLPILIRHLALALGSVSDNFDIGEYSCSICMKVSYLVYLKMNQKVSDYKI